MTTRTPSPVAELLARADAARRAGHTAAAIAALATIVDEHADHPDAAVAAYTLGRVQLHADAAAAAVAFDRAIELGLPHSLRELAHVRLVEAQVRNHATDAASVAAARYRAAFPDGAHAEEVERWLAAP